MTVRLFNRSLPKMSFATTATLLAVSASTALGQINHVDPRGPASEESQFERFSGPTVEQGFVRPDLDDSAKTSEGFRSVNPATSSVRKDRFSDGGHDHSHDHDHGQQEGYSILARDDNQSAGFANPDANAAPVSGVRAFLQESNSASSVSPSASLKPQRDHNTASRPTTVVGADDVRSRPVEPPAARQPITRQSVTSSPISNGQMSINDLRDDQGASERSPVQFSTGVASLRDANPAATRSDLQNERPVREGVRIDRAVQPVAYQAPMNGFAPDNSSAGSFGQGSLRQQDPNSAMTRQSQPQRRTLQPQQQQQPDNRRNDAAPSNRSAASGSADGQAVIEPFRFRDGANQQSTGLSLADALRQSQGRIARQPLINQYWETFYDHAQSVSSDRLHQWYQTIQASKAADAASVRVAISSARNEGDSNRIQLGKSQAKLKQMLGSTTALTPSDVPTVTRVGTNYEAFRQRGMIPPRFEGIDQTLSELHSLVQSRAATAALSQQTADEVHQFYSRSQASIEHLLSAGRAWRAAEADFIASAVEYNKAYADYALALPYGRGPIEKVIGMLITEPSSASQASSPLSSSRPDLSRQPSRPTGQSPVRSASRSNGSERQQNDGAQNMGRRQPASSNQFSSAAASNSRAQPPRQTQPRSSAGDTQPAFADSGFGDTGFGGSNGTTASGENRIQRPSPFPASNSINGPSSHSDTRPASSSGFNPGGGFNSGPPAASSPSTTRPPASGFSFGG